ncbi:MAG: (2Fe-2S)-binding protein [Pseudomonadota bacterium]
MIVCQCNVISRRDIETAIDAIISKDPWVQVTQGMVYRHLGKRGRCGGCAPTVVDLIVELIEKKQRLATQETPESRKAGPIRSRRGRIDVGFRGARTPET